MRRWPDPQALVFDPDYASKSGESVRTIGDSPSFGDILTVITANDRDRRYYGHGGL